MKVKEQREGRRAAVRRCCLDGEAAGGEPHLPSQPVLGHCWGMPGHCRKASVGICWLA